MVVQVDGKKRGIVEVSNLGNSELLKLVMELPSVVSSLFGRKVFRIIEVKNKLVNVVTTHCDSA